MLLEVFIFCLTIIVGSFVINKLRKVDEVPEVEQAAQPEPPQLLDIQSRDTLIGHFRGLPIYKFVVIKPNRLFMYESIVVELQPGIPFVDAPDQNYITVDQVFLYREIPVTPE